MKLNSITNHSIIMNNIEKINSINKISNTKTNNFEKNSFVNSNVINSFGMYNKSGTSYSLNTNSLGPLSCIDKGTALETTVHINRAAFDQILFQTTYGDVKWEEMGVDDEKRWVVINGQRFEVEHSPEEKALRKKMQRMNLVDILTDLEKEKKYKKNMQNDKEVKPKGNIEALKGNVVVMDLLKSIFNKSSDQEVLNEIA